MTRIVAGHFRGRRLVTPAGTATRPTSERVREAVFARLDHLGVLAGARVLELYCGSGSLGLEALSRGAASLVLVDVAKAATTAATRNVQTLGSENVQVVTADAARFLARRPTGAFDVVLLDPPYDLPEARLAEVLDALDAPGVLAPQALVVLERATRSGQPRWPRAWADAEAKRYGETTVWFAPTT